MPGPFVRQRLPVRTLRMPGLAAGGHDAHPRRRRRRLLFSADDGAIDLASFPVRCRPVDDHRSALAVQSHRVPRAQALVVADVRTRRPSEHLAPERRPRVRVLEHLDLALQGATRLLRPMTLGRHQFQEAPTIPGIERAAQAAPFEERLDRADLHARPRRALRDGGAAAHPRDELAQTLAETWERRTQPRLPRLALVAAPIPVREQPRRREVHPTPARADAALKPLELLRAILDAAALDVRLQVHNAGVGALHPALRARERNQVIPDDAPVRRHAAGPHQQIQKVRLDEILDGHAGTPRRRLLIEDGRGIPLEAPGRAEVVEAAQVHAVGDTLRPGALLQLPLPDQRRILLEEDVDLVEHPQELGLRQLGGRLP